MLEGIRREDFPVLNRLTYLNTASTGLVPRSVFEPAHAFEAVLSEAGTTGMDEAEELAIFDGAREGAGKLLNAPTASIAVTTSFTEALCQFAWWLKPTRGQNIVSTDADFPSVTYPWLRISEDTGCEVRLVPVLEDPDSFGIDKIAEYVDDSTAAICISHVQYLTGHRLDLRALADLAHSHGALLIVDATQSAGQLPIDVAADDVDVLIAGSYKWLCSTFGAALCYIRPSLLDEFKPPFVGWRSTPSPYDLDARWQGYANGAQKMEYSTMSYTSAISLAAAINYLSDLNLDEIATHNADLADLLIDGLSSRGAQLLTPRERSRRAGTVTARFGDRDSEAVASQLTKRGVIVSPRVGSTRFSMHFYNSEADVAHALRTLDDVLAN